MRRSTASARIIGAALAALVLVPAGASAAPIDVGAGEDPAVAIDAAGTAYIAWVTTGADPTRLEFCRLPRGAKACDVQGPIAANGTSITRPYVQVDDAGVHVLSYRYALGDPFDQVLSFTSRNGGATWDAGVPVGDTPFSDAFPGPDAGGVSLVTNAVTGGGFYQQVGISGPKQPRAKLFDEPFVYNATVAQAVVGGKPAPVVVSTDAIGNAKFRQSDPNACCADPDKWSQAPQPFARVDYPRLAAGPRGVFLMGADTDGVVKVRRYTPGTGFGTPRPLPRGRGEHPQSELTEDPAGRLHAFLPQITARGMELKYATSRNGRRWRSRQVVLPDLPLQVRAAFGADHGGTAVWYYRSTGRIFALGFPPPLDLPNRTPAKARRKGSQVVVTFKGKVPAPSTGTCAGKFRASISRGGKRIAKAKMRLKPNCTFTKKIRFPASKLRGKRKLKLKLSYGGSLAAGKSTGRYTLKVK